jgi:chromosome segregation ATPase
MCEKCDQTEKRLEQDLAIHTWSYTLLQEELKHTREQYEFAKRCWADANLKMRSADFDGDQFDDLYDMIEYESRNMHQLDIEIDALTIKIEKCKEEMDTIKVELKKLEKYYYEIPKLSQEYEDSFFGACSASKSRFQKHQRIYVE